MASISAEQLYQIALLHRSLFYRAWNQLRAVEDQALSLSDLVEACVEKIPQTTRRAVPLPPGTDFIHLLDARYPRELYELPQPPIGIFVKGQISQEPRVSVVGSRKPSSYALRLTREVSKQWMDLGFQIVSGGALGIDSLAHEVAVREGRPTWVVMGSGFHHLYPKKNLRLYEEVLESGGVWISEYHPSAEPRAYQFPERNRIIAALGHACFLAQAHEKSGSLLTARTALDLGRDVYVLRPVAGDAMFSGSRQLIDEGAKSLVSAAQLQEEPLLHLYTSALPPQNESDSLLQSRPYSH